MIFYFGSFQIGDMIDAEHPLEAVWSYVERLAALDFLERRSGPGSSSARYAAVRTRQAVELRNASHATSLVTSPLTLYYSALNLTRAGIAVVTGKEAKAAHGLRYVKAPDLLANGARFTSGTFTDLLAAWGHPRLEDGVLTLADCLAAVPELADQYAAVLGRPSRAVPVGVRYVSRLHLEFEGETIPAFSTEWKR